MRDKTLDRLLRQGAGAPPPGPVPGGAHRPRRPAGFAAILLGLAVLALLALPIALAFTGNSLDLLIGIAIGDPLLF